MSGWEMTHPDYFFSTRGICMKYLLGIDVSTTTAKALLMDQKGTILAVGSTPQSLSTPYPLWSEQNPQDWWQGVAQSIHQILEETKIQSSDIAAIGLTGQMHGLVILDQAGKVLRPAILWNDQRTGAECDQIRERLGRDRLIQITGNDALTGFTAPKILWVQNHEPDLYTKIKHILLPKDFIRYCLTGDFAMDKADGSGTILFDLKQRNWSPEVLSALSIPADWMPPTYEGSEVTGKISPEAARITGLAAGTPVVAGGGDQAAQAVGVGVVDPGVIALTVGTSGVVFATTPSALIEPQGRLHAFCHAVPDKWHLMGVMLSAAGSLQWYRDTLAAGISFDTLLQEAELVPPGSEGLIFLPYLTGERTPYPDPLARGAFIGLTVRHTRGHLTRAVLEGVAFGLKDSFGLIQSAGLGQINQVRASGGAMKGALWRQILADILGTDLVETNTTEGGAFGAALLAGVGVGIWKDVPTACVKTVQLTRTTHFDQHRSAEYQNSYTIYQSLYPLLQPTFARIGK
jgi:xylulokinase